MPRPIQFSGYCWLSWEFSCKPNCPRWIIFSLLARHQPVSAVWVGSQFVAPSASGSLCLASIINSVSISASGMLKWLLLSLRPAWRPSPIAPSKCSEILENGCSSVTLSALCVVRLIFSGKCCLFHSRESHVASIHIHCMLEVFYD